jgi:hypothetical protein
MYPMMAILRRRRAAGCDGYRRDPRETVTLVRARGASPDDLGQVEPRSAHGQVIERFDASVALSARPHIPQEARS